MLDKARYWVGAPLRHRMRRQTAAFLETVQDTRSTQQRVLQRLLRLNAESGFGREHAFERISNIADFRNQLPVTTYEYYRPYIEHLKAGDSSALLGPTNKLLMFSLTSGTTSGAKYIPITSQFMADYRRGWRVWGISAFDAQPHLYLHRIVQLASDYDQFRTDGGTPCGNISGLAATLQNPLVRSMYTVPPAVMKIDDPVAKYYTALRVSIADAKVGMITTANPSTLLHMAKLADEHKEELIRDIARGTLSTQLPIADNVRRSLRFRLRANPRRARELEGIVSRTGHLYPRDYWPNLRLLSVWTGGSVGAYLAGLPEFFGNIPIRDHGLSASEGRMTIPLANGSTSGVLDTNSHFFEFIPEEEFESKNPIVLEAHELEEGQNYYILLTTSSGFCRYDIHDVVRCTGFMGTAPMLEFLNKGAHISSITGEKLTEHQVVASVRECVERMQLNLGHFTVAPAWGEPPRYHFLVEESHLPSPAIGAQLVSETDARLQKINPEYGDKRKTGRLGPMNLELLPQGTWEKFCRKRQSKVGGSIEQYKHPCLVPQLDFLSEFMEEFVDGNRRAPSSIPRPYSLSAGRVESR